MAHASCTPRSKPVSKHTLATLDTDLLKSHRMPVTTLSPSLFLSLRPSLRQRSGNGLLAGFAAPSPNLCLLLWGQASRRDQNVLAAAPASPIPCPRFQATVRLMSCRGMCPPLQGRRQLRSRMQSDKPAPLLRTTSAVSAPFPEPPEPFLPGAHATNPPPRLRHPATHYDRVKIPTPCHLRRPHGRRR